MHDPRLRVIVAMSGGVDSSVAAALLVEEGHEVIGVTMKLHHGEGGRQFGGCCTFEDVEDARRVARVLGIPHYVVNLIEAFERAVVDDFVSEYGRGRTPNPCIRCNQHVKFDVLMRRAQELEAEHIATGHYARISRDGTTGQYRLLRGVDESKDQSYVLYMMNQEQLARTLMPLGWREKADTRTLARRLGMDIADKPDSQEICFVEHDDYARFVLSRNPSLSRPGDIVDSAGNRLGQHRGVVHYTIGQRHGLGLAMPHPVYVTSIDAATNTLTVGPAEELLADGLVVADLHWVSGSAPGPGSDLEVKIRYNAAAVPARIAEVGTESATAHFQDPQRAVTPGQAAVFYRGEEVLGGGTIEASVCLS